MEITEESALNSKWNDDDGFQLNKLKRHVQGLISGKGSDSKPEDVKISKKARTLSPPLSEGSEGSEDEDKKKAVVQSKRGMFSFF